MKEYVSSSDGYPIVPDGVYEAQCINYDKKFVLGRTRKVFLKFKILDLGEHHGKVIFQAYNMPYDGKIMAGSK
jgi:hypothetical protein